MYIHLHQEFLNFSVSLQIKVFYFKSSGVSIMQNDHNDAQLADWHHLSLLCGIKNKYINKIIYSPVTKLYIKYSIHKPLLNKCTNSIQ